MVPRLQFIRSKGNKSAGFTLVEALVAITIFAFIGLGAYQILDNIVRVEAQSAVHSQQMATLQKVVWQMGKDFRLIAGRPIVDEEGDPLEAIDIEGDYIIEFTRRGWSNPLNWPRSVLQRVAYDIDYHPDRDDSDSPYYEDESLYLLRHYWQVLDRGPDSLRQTQVLLKDVSDFYVRFYARGAASREDLWVDQLETKFPGSNAAAGNSANLANFDIPNAIEINLVVGESDLFTYAFAVGAGGNQ